MESKSYQHLHFSQSCHPSSSCIKESAIWRRHQSWGTKNCVIKGKEAFSKLYIFGIYIADLQLEMVNL